MASHARTLGARVDFYSVLGEDDNSSIARKFLQGLGDSPWKIWILQNFVNFTKNM